MVQLKTNVRVKAEGTGIIAKSMVTFLVLVYDVGDVDRLALLAFALGQLAYSFSCWMVYLGYLGARPLWPDIKCVSSLVNGVVLTFNSHKLDLQLFRLSATMTWQSLVKHVLTEGDKLILSWFSPLQDQGGYALAVNYGTCVLYSFLAIVYCRVRIVAGAHRFSAYRGSHATLLLKNFCPRG